jgi:cell wall-associated NlpC family hydrolase
MSWKTAVSEYVNAKNRAEAEHSAAPLRAVLARDAGAFAERERTLAAADRCRAARGIRPQQQETRLRLHPLHESRTEAAAELELSRTISYELRGRTHTEQRIERERIVLAHTGADRWAVASVQRRQPPDGYMPQAAGAMRHYAAGRPELGHMSASVPYLNNSILNPGETSSRKMYNRGAVVQYAETWWNGANPRYIEFEVDCTNFVSQCLFAGGMPMNYTGKRDSGWWYRGRVGGQELWSYSWAIANALPRYLLASGRARQVASPLELAPGDMIGYDWDGDGRYQHSTIVTALDASGAPLVNAHTYNARGRYWSYHDSPAWSERTTYIFLRVADQF